MYLDNTYYYDNFQTLKLLLKDFSTGKRVEARYKGRGNWYKGVVANVNPDGTIDITYDDGEVDLSLHSKYVRLVQEGLYMQ